MNVIISYLSFWLWCIGRNIVHLLKYIRWKLNGTSKILSEMDTNINHPYSIQVQKIVSRYKHDIMFGNCGESNFISTHYTFETFNYLMKPNISLYNIDLERKQAIFVETGHTIHVTDSAIGCFMHVNQYSFANKMISLSLNKFLQFSSMLGRPQAKLLFVSNTGRCGSTLLVQILEATGLCIVINEPAILQTLYTNRNNIDPEMFDKLITATINIFCKPVRKGVEMFVIKNMASSTGLVPHLRRLYPHAQQLFMYRNGAAVTRSLDRSMHTNSYLQLLVFLSQFIPAIRRKLLFMFDIPQDDNIRPGSLVQLASIRWAFNMRKYLKYVSNDIGIVGIRYEDIVLDKEHALHRLFDHIGLAYHMEKLEDAFSRDSQQGTPISMTSLKGVKMDRITRADMKWFEQIAKVYELPSLNDSHVFANTITYRENWRK